MTEVQVPVSIGELLDKLAILRIKAARIQSPAKRANVGEERQVLEQIAAAHVSATPALAALQSDLEAVNAQLWDIEEAIRACETHGDFGVEFVRLARAVYQTNDRRAAIKRAINELSRSRLVEEKSYDLPSLPERS